MRLKDGDLYKFVGTNRSVHYVYILNRKEKKLIYFCKDLNSIFANSITKFIINLFRESLLESKYIKITDKELIIKAEKLMVAEKI